MSIYQDIIENDGGMHQIYNGFSIARVCNYNESMYVTIMKCVTIMKYITKMKCVTIMKKILEELTKYLEKGEQIRTK